VAVASTRLPTIHLNIEPIHRLACFLPPPQRPSSLLPRPSFHSTAPCRSHGYAIETRRSFCLHSPPLPSWLSPRKESANPFCEPTRQPPSRTALYISRQSPVARGHRTGPDPTKAGSSCTRADPGRCATVSRLATCRANILVTQARSRSVSCPDAYPAADVRIRTEWPSFFSIVQQCPSVDQPREVPNSLRRWWGCRKVLAVHFA
jgi:hypothetical protein